MLSAYSDTIDINKILYIDSYYYYEIDMISGILSGSGINAGNEIIHYKSN